jgi:hypothetical protein
MCSPKRALYADFRERMKHRYWARVSSACVLCTFALGGCGGSVQDDTNSGAPIAQADLPAAFAAAACDGLAPCCLAAGYGYDETTCRERVPFIKSFLEFADDGYEVYDSVAARGCVDAWAVAEQSCSPKAFDAADPRAVCLHVIKGTEPLDAPCNTELDCVAPATNCARKIDGSTHCQAALVEFEHGRVGDACAQSCSGKCSYTPLSTDVGVQAACYEEDGLGCNASHVCEPLAQLGQACGDAGCIVDASCRSGTCVSSGVSEPTTIATPQNCGATP